MTFGRDEDTASVVACMRATFTGSREERKGRLEYYASSSALIYAKITFAFIGRDWHS